MIFQDPYASLNPRRPSATSWRGAGDPPALRAAARRARVRELLERVGLAPEHAALPARVLGRPAPAIGIARALAVEPSFSSATSRSRRSTSRSRRRSSTCSSDLQRELELTYLFIAHDLSVVRAHLRPRRRDVPRQDRRDCASRTSIYSSPRHPYTVSLISAIPILDPRSSGRAAHPASGDLPSPVDPPSGCRFRTRCFRAQERCALEEPPLKGPPGRSTGSHVSTRSRAWVARPRSGRSRDRIPKRGGHVSQHPSDRFRPSSSSDSRPTSSSRPGPPPRTRRSSPTRSSTLRRAATSPRGCSGSSRTSRPPGRVAVDRPSSGCCAKRRRPSRGIRPTGGVMWRRSGRSRSAPGVRSRPDHALA